MVRSLTLWPHHVLVAAALLAGCGEGGGSSEPDLPDPPKLSEDDRGFLDRYAEVQAEAAELDVEGFLAKYPPPPVVQALGYDPDTAVGLDAITAAYPLSDAQQALLHTNGFVALPASPWGATPEEHYSAVYNKDLPVLVTTDSILYALHRSFDSMLADTERSFLALEVDLLLRDLHETLAAELAAGSIPPALEAAAAEVDVYLAVARSLLADQVTPAVTGAGADARVAQVLDAVAAEGVAALRLFGATNASYDFSQMKPRGHYEDETLLQQYFRALMWLGRTELPIVVFPPGQSAKFNRVAFDGAALLDHLLAESGSLPRWQGIDRVLHTMIGEQDSMGPDDLRTFLGSQGDPDLKGLAALPDDKIFSNLMETHYGLQRIMSQIMYTDPSEPELVLPRVYLLLGQRFTLDSYVFHNVTFDRLHAKDGSKTLRMLPNELDVQFVLGNHAAGALLEPELAKYGHQGVLHELRFLTDSHPEAFWRESFYNGWLSSIRALNAGEDERSRYPEPMRTLAWQHKTLTAQAASRAELRHDTLLYAKQSYSGGIGCEYPDGYVEPALGFYREMQAVGELGLELVKRIEEAGYAFDSGRAYFENWQAVIGTLTGIVEKELAGEGLASEEISFLRRVVETEEVGCGETLWDGWYPSLFYAAEDVASYEPTIADVHTAPTDELGNPVGWVLHAGTGASRLLILTVPSCDGGNVSAYVGPASTVHAVLTENFERLTDSEWLERVADSQTEPAWVQSYAE